MRQQLDVPRSKSEDARTQAENYQKALGSTEIIVIASKAPEGNQRVSRELPPRACLVGAALALT
jgi:hypothetical protein